MSVNKRSSEDMPLVQESLRCPEWYRPTEKCLLPEEPPLDAPTFLKPVKTEPIDPATFEIQPATELTDALGYRLDDSGSALLNRLGKRIDLTCSNCRRAIRLPTFTCTKSKHQICLDCRAWCGACDSSVVESDPDDLLEQISGHLKFRCRNGCGGYFASDVNTHESTCKPRVLRCPLCPFEIGSLGSTLMRIHLLDDHRVRNFCGAYEVEPVKLALKHKSSGKLSFLSNGRLCYLEWSRDGLDHCYDLRFGLLDDEPNVRLGMVYFDTKCLYKDVLSKVSINELNCYEPYVNFNYAK